MRGLGEKLGAAAGYATLAIFDFDGTLFRSPQPPTDDRAELAKWWRSENSLLPPFVPERPDGSWWNGAVVHAARKAISDEDTLAVVLTGRRDNAGLRKRVEGLLRMGGLTFDAVYMNPDPAGTAVEWKTSKIKAVLGSAAGVETVQVWDDLADNVNALESVARMMGLAVEAHFVSTNEELRYLSGKLRSLTSG